MAWITRKFFNEEKYWKESANSENDNEPELYSNGGHRLVKVLDRGVLPSEYRGGAHCDLCRNSINLDAID